MIGHRLKGRSFVFLCFLISGVNFFAWANIALAHDSLPTESELETVGTNDVARVEGQVVLSPPRADDETLESDLVLWEDLVRGVMPYDLKPWWWGLWPWLMVIIASLSMVGFVRILGENKNNLNQFSVG